MKFVLSHYKLTFTKILGMKLRYTSLAPLPSYKYVQHNINIVSIKKINSSPEIYSIFNFKFIIYDYPLLENHKDWSQPIQPNMRWE